MTSLLRALCVFACALVIGRTTLGQNCPSLVENPVASISPDDIPATGIDIVTYTGSLVKARANHNVAYVQITPNDERVWFGVDGSPGLYRTFYNRRVRDDLNGPWRWLYSPSPAIITYTAPASAVASSVHYSDVAKYRDPGSNLYFKFVMYQVVQPGTCDGHVAGFLYVAFSNDGICWTQPAQVGRSNFDGPAFDCYPNHWNTVPVEQMQSVDGGDRIYLIGVEGDIDALAVPTSERGGYWAGNEWREYYTYRRWSQMDQSLTYVGWASYDDPSSVHLLQTPEISILGMFHPQARFSSSNRYTPYAYFMNLSIAYDSTGGYLYIARGYPYPYERASLYRAALDDPSQEPVEQVIADPPTDDQTPSLTQMQFRKIAGPRGDSWVEGCLGPPYTPPNRVQVYRMHIASLANIARITTPTNYYWEFLLDLGGATGYEWLDGSPAGSGSGTDECGTGFWCHQLCARPQRKSSAERRGPGNRTCVSHLS